MTRRSTKTKAPAAQPKEPAKVEVPVEEAKGFDPDLVPDDEDGPAPTDLPEPVDIPERDILNSGRKCVDCGQEARIVSNELGVQAYCGPCKKDWPIRQAAPIETSAMGPRSLSKQTVSEPDWGLAFETLPDDNNP